MDRIILDFAKEFKKLRNELGETQEGLSDITGIPLDTIKKWETKKTTPTKLNQKIYLNLLEDLIEQRFYRELL